MPMRDEFIERAIRQLGAAIARLMGKSSPVTQEEVALLRSEAATLYLPFLGASAEFVDRLGVEDLLNVLRSAGYVDGERAYLLSALLETEAQAELFEGASPEDATVLRLRSRALDLMLESGLSGLGEEDIAARVERLMRAVPAETLRSETWQRLFRYRFEIGDFAKAEDALFSWLASGEAGGRESARDAGRSFYRSLAELTDEQLEAGGLPREELAEGLQALGA